MPDQPGAGGPAPFDCGVRGLCPRCAASTLFRSPVAFADRCSACGLDFAGFNVGDGPAAFLTLGIGTIITVLAIWLELAAGPPWWVHVLLWLPLTVIGVVGSLRIAKGMLIALEYKRGAREGADRPTPVKRLPIFPTLIVLLAVAAMVALGMWQLQRRAEKAALIAHARANLDRPVQPLPARITDNLLFARVTATCARVGDWTMGAGRAVDGSSGYRHIAACTGPTGQPFRVDMGVAADPKLRPVWRGGPVAGTLSQAPGGPTLLDRMTGRITPPAPMIVSDSPAPGLSPSHRPDPASLPDNHLAYAIQWFAFALAAVIIYLLALRRRSR